MARGPMDLWNEWATQILVLLSLALQVVLLLFAGIRRREASSVLRSVLWLAYLLADSTAIYAVGHLAFSSAPREHQLVAFWAPFLLLHLGGPDSITAYALEDNTLWRRHFLTLVVQVLGAGYVLYKRIAGSGSLVVLAAVLMFVVGVLKYGERTLALGRANFSSIRSSLKEKPHSKHQWYQVQGYLGDQDVDDEFLLQRAHSLFHICKRAIVDCVIAEDSINGDTEIIEDLKKDDKFWTVMEMELSLMYDILYTKAAVIHTLVGYCIRVVSPLAIVVSLLLFQFSGKDGHSRVDVAITYVLLGGAFLLETASLLSALGSSWTLAFLCATRWSWLRHAALCAGRWHRLRRAVVYLRRLVKIMTGSSSLYGSRRWSGTMTMGQFNMLQFRTAQIDPTNRRFGRLANMLWLSEWWDRKQYSWTVVIAEEVKERTNSMLTMFSKRDLNTMGMIRHNWGEVAMSKHDGLEDKVKARHGVDFHESIISWHIATDLFLGKSTGAKAEGAVDRVKAIRALSNYMMFLLVNRPYMLPGLPQNWLYQKNCENLDEICEKHRESLLDSQGRTNVCAVLKKLFRSRDYLKSSRHERTKDLLAKYIFEDPALQQSTDFFKVPRLTYARKIAAELLSWENDPVDVLLDMWTDFLAYAANRCSRESHAKKLNSGGELTTIIWLMIEHLYQTKQKEGP